MRLKRLINKLAHYGIGIVSGFVWFIDWKLSVFLYLMFFAYEYIEETKIEDEMYRELKEFTIGFIGGLAIYGLLHV